MTPIAPCSLVPQPTTSTCWPDSAAARSSAARRWVDSASASLVSNRAANAGSAAIISVMNHGEPPRSTG